MHTIHEYSITITIIIIIFPRLSKQKTIAMCSFSRKTSLTRMSIHVFGTAAKLNYINFYTKTVKQIVTLRCYHNSYLAKVQYLCSSFYWFMISYFGFSILFFHFYPPKELLAPAAKTDFCLVLFMVFPIHFYLCQGIVMIFWVIYRGTKSLYNYKSNGNRMSKDEC